MLRKRNKLIENIKIRGRHAKKRISLKVSEKINREKIKAHREKIRAFFLIVVVILLFFLVSVLIQKWVVDVSILEENLAISVVVFVLIAALESVIAPLSIFPLIPLASNLFGWIPTALLSIVGWTLGALIAFKIARVYGKPLVKKLVSLEKLEEFEKKLPEQHFFLTIVLLRMFATVDFLSYALGLFSRMKTSTYIYATIIGLIPFAFVVAYLGIIPLRYQIIGIAIGLIVIFFGGWLTLRYINRSYDKRQKQALA